MKKFFTFLSVLLTVFALAQPSNDNCTGATSLTVGSALQCSTTNNAGLQAGECFTNYSGGSSETSVWYRFTATNDSLVLNLIKTNSTNCTSPHVRVYGPFASGAGCLPACTSTIVNTLLSGDPGNHLLLSGLSTTSGNSDYLIQVQSNDCGGSGDGFTNFCINLQNPAANAYASGASNVNACGSAFGGSTNGGYWQNGTGTGFNNLDNNNSTTCSGCATSGQDSPFIINNVSWFSFCSATAGTWQITVSGVSGCALSAPNQGVQASVFTGTTTALVNQGNSQNPIPVGGSWTSGVITVNAGSCAWLMIDGFAGDACNYNVTLTNVTGGCLVLPVDIANFNGYRSNAGNVLEWTTLSERLNKEFSIERSADGQTWTMLGTVHGNYNSSTKRYYTLVDPSPLQGLNYYRLKQTDVNGSFEYFRTISIDNQMNPEIYIESVSDLLGNSFGNSVPSDFKGVLLVRYSNGITRKMVISE